MRRFDPCRGHGALAQLDEAADSSSASMWVRVPRALPRRVNQLGWLGPVASRNGPRGLGFEYSALRAGTSSGDQKMPWLRPRISRLHWWWNR
jgi:hypothetical protein